MIDGFFFKKHLEDDEHVQRIVHKHWAVGLRFLLFPSVSFLFAWFVLAFRHSTAAAAIIGLWGIVSLVWWFRNFLDYYLDAWVVTDHGIIDLEWLGWFHRQSSRILYSDIQGVSTETHGITGTLLGYGTVSIEKISTGAAISISHVPKPRSVESLILHQMETYLHSKNLKNAKHVEELLSTFVAGHVQEEKLTRGKKPAMISSDSTTTTSRPTKNTFKSSRV